MKTTKDIYDNKYRLKCIAKNKALDHNNKLEQPDKAKTCRACKEHKPLTFTYWHKDISRPDGLNTACKDCMAKIQQRPARVYTQIKQQAKQRNLSFTITKEQHATLIKQPCYICGGIAIGWLDRIDSNKGYAPDNVKSACSTCNKMKLAHPLDFFISHIKKIIANQ